MTLCRSDYFCSAVEEDLHISLNGSLPDCGIIFSVLPAYPDPGSCVFTVNACGLSQFILLNSGHITLTVNAFECPGVFAPVSACTPCAAQKKQRIFRSPGLFSAKAAFRQRAVLRL